MRSRPSCRGPNRLIHALTHERNRGGLGLVETQRTMICSALLHFRWPRHRRTQMGIVIGRVTYQLHGRNPRWQNMAKRMPIYERPLRPVYESRRLLVRLLQLQKSPWRRGRDGLHRRHCQRSPNTISIQGRKTRFSRSIRQSSKLVPVLLLGPRRLTCTSVRVFCGLNSLGAWMTRARKSTCLLKCTTNCLRLSSCTIDY